MKCIQRKNESREDYYNRLNKQISENCIANGHFVTSVLIENHRNHLRKWFRFPSEIEENVDKRISKLRSDYHDRELIAIHFRTGEEYFINGFVIKHDYWEKAAEEIRQRYKNPLFLCFYDQINVRVQKFLSQNDAMDASKGLIEDFCMMTKCDGNIVCNRSFGIMAALMNIEAKYTVCPDKYPTGKAYLGKDVYLEEWIHIPVRRNLKSFICGKTKRSK